MSGKKTDKIDGGSRQDIVSDSTRIGHHVRNCKQGTRDITKFSLCNSVTGLYRTRSEFNVLVYGKSGDF